MKNTINWITITILSVAVAFTFYAEKSERFKVPDPDTPTEGENAVETTTDVLDVWIEQLGDMERCSPQGTWDSGSYSYGRWCYKEGTFRYFVRKFEMFPHTEDYELMNLIGDEDIQRKLTRLVFEDSYRNTSHWYTSVYIRGLGDPPLM